MSHWVPIRLAQRQKRLKKLDRTKLLTDAKAEAITNRVWARTNAIGKINLMVALVPIPLP